MKTYVGTLMTSFTSIDRVRLSDEVIKNVLENQPKVPVTVDFNMNAIGSSRAFVYEKEKLLCEFDLEEGQIPPMIERAYIVPGLDNVRFHYEGRVRVIDAGDLNVVSISLLPADQHLTPIRLKGE